MQDTGLPPSLDSLTSSAMQARKHKLKHARLQWMASLLALSDDDLQTEEEDSHIQPLPKDEETKEAPSLC